jgi:hypothetical protein
MTGTNNIYTIGSQLVKTLCLYIIWLPKLPLKITPKKPGILPLSHRQISAVIPDRISSCAWPCAAAARRPQGHQGAAAWGVETRGPAALILYIGKPTLASSDWCINFALWSPPFSSSSRPIIVPEYPSNSQSNSIHCFPFLQLTDGIVWAQVAFAADGFVDLAWSRWDGRPAHGPVHQWRRVRRPGQDPCDCVMFLNL